MKLVVFSDAHGAQDIVQFILDVNTDADYFISLGDHELSQDYLLSNDIIPIKGNAARDAGFVFERELEVEGMKLLLTHGHKFAIHRGLNKIGKYAIQKGYDVVLFGHTHIVEVKKIGKLLFLNPGSCASPRNTLPPTYMILDIDKEEITYTIKESFTNRTIEV